MEALKSLREQGVPDNLLKPIERWNSPPRESANRAQRAYELLVYGQGFIVSCETDDGLVTFVSVMDKLEKRTIDINFRLGDKSEQEKWMPWVRKVKAGL
jgi:hypothetical protein